MCGILFIANGLAVACGTETTHVGREAASPAAADFAEGLACRGPDAYGSHSVACGPGTLLSFRGSLLQLRGTAPSSTPLVDAAGNTLLFNGQVFPPCGLHVPPGATDAQVLLQALGLPGAHVPAMLTGLRGPWALVYWHGTTRTLWFGRDPVGRRSLLLHLPSEDDGRFMLSSSAPLDPAVPFTGFTELPPGIYSLTLPQWEASAGASSRGTAAAAAAAGAGAGSGSGAAAAATAVVQPLPATASVGVVAAAAVVVAAAAPGEATAAGRTANGAGHSACGEGAPAGTAGKLVAQYERHEWTDPAVQQLASFRRAPKLMQPPPPALAAAAAAGVQAEAAADGDGGRHRETAAAGPSAADAAGQSEAAAAAIEAQAGDSDAASFECTVDAVLAALRQAVTTRCRCIEERQEPEGQEGHQQCPSTPCCNGATPAAAAAAAAAADGDWCPPQQQAPLQPAPGLPASGAQQLPLLPPAPVLILFSGGVDSTLLAALAHQALPVEVPIDLASVCFDGGRSPDRLSALDALEELRGLAPGREWRLILVDCTLADVEGAHGRLLRLLAPSDTVMDLNIGAALWLAARGAGSLLSGAAEQQKQQRAEEDAAATAVPQQDVQQPQHDAAGQQPGTPPTPACCCRSAARAVLLGHGADELFGGYGRHRTAFRERSWEGLGEELELDLRRLWLRNLGRDDRLVADHGREARHPFLDEGVIAAALAAPLHHLADLREAPGTGDKRVLRACLRRLGLPRAAARAKRAIQFGSRLAKHSNASHFGSSHRANRRNAGSVRLADVAVAAAATALEGVAAT